MTMSMSVEDFLRILELPPSRAKHGVVDLSGATVTSESAEETLRLIEGLSKCVARDSPNARSTWTLRNATIVSASASASASACDAIWNIGPPYEGNSGLVLDNVFLKNVAINVCGGSVTFHDTQITCVGNCITVSSDRFGTGGYVKMRGGRVFESEKAGFHVMGGRLLLTDVEISDNSGRGIEAVSGNAWIDVVGGTIRGSGIGVSVEDGCRVSLANVTFVDNASDVRESPNSIVEVSDDKNP